MQQHNNSNRSVMHSADADLYATVKSKAAIASALAMITQNVTIIIALFNNSSLSARGWVTFALALINCLISFTIGALSLLLADKHPSPADAATTNKNVALQHGIENQPQQARLLLREIGNAQGENVAVGESYEVINFTPFHQHINKIIEYLAYVLLVINIPIVALAARE